MKFTMYHRFTENVRNIGIEKTVEKALALGFSSVEMFADLAAGDQNPIYDLPKATHMRTILDSCGLPLSCYSVYADLWQNPAAEEELRKHVRIAAALGSPYFHHTLLPWLALSDTAPTFENAIQAAAETAVKIADYAATLGMTCIYEDQGYYVNGVRGFRIFWDIVKSRCKNVGICGDLGNILFVNEKPEDFLIEFAPDIRHVHVKDYHQQQSDISPGQYWIHTKDGIWLRDAVIGNGVVDFKNCLKILKDSGYTGCFALENSHPEPFEEGVRQAMDLLSGFWQYD